MRKKLISLTAITKPAPALRPIICLVFLTTSLLGLIPSAMAQDQASEVSFTTPEDAITFYLQAVSQGDVSQIMQACAVTEMSANFSFELFTNRLRALTMTSPAPSDYPFFAEINEAQFSWQILNQVKNLAYGLLATEKDVVAGYTVIMEPAGTTQFMHEVDPARLTQLQVTQMGIPMPDLAASERNLENWNKLAQIYGADEYTERVVLLQFEGNYYYVGFALLRYGENWKISSAGSALGGTNPAGAPQPTTVNEFQELISGS